MNVTRRSQKQLKIQMETGLEAARDSRESRMGSQHLVELRLPWGRKLRGLGRGGGTKCHPTITFQWLSLCYVSLTSIFKSTYKVNAKMIRETDHIETVNT